MKLLRHPNLPAIAKGCVATIGNFDGLHTAHQHIIRHVQDKARALGLPAVVISFEPLPGEYFSRDSVARIYPLRDKVRYLIALDVDYFACLRFDSAFAGQEAEDFIRDTLLGRLRVEHLVVGDDFRFGRARRGDYEMLRALGEALNSELIADGRFALFGAMIVLMMVFRPEGLVTRTLIERLAGRKTVVKES